MLVECESKRRIYRADLIVGHTANFNIGRRRATQQPSSPLKS